ncbi:MAG: PmoA family protein [Bacteroidales bacterium]|nr:PmoA family protein [Bacteroidales bacterium]
MKHLLYVILLLLLFSCKTSSNVEFVENPDQKSIEIWINKKHFTTYLYNSEIEKPVLYPIYTASGTLITRGFPLKPRINERIDHPHQIGLWFNFGDINGLDFWNNSYAIAPENKSHYGSIIFKNVVSKKDNKLIAVSDWVDNNGKVLLEEETTFVFSGDNNTRIIERIAKLTAKDSVTFKGNKEGMVAIRLDRVFEEKLNVAEMLIDSTLIPIKTLNNDGVNGFYKNNIGSLKNEIWGKRAVWTAAMAEKNGEKITVVILDNNKNINYPGWSFARGYGLFALNNLGGKAFDEKYDKPVILNLSPGESVVFRYKFLIRNDDKFMSDSEIDKYNDSFNL